MTDPVKEVLAGRLRAIARMMSAAEAGFEESRPALAEIHRHAGKAHVVGVTGVPGSGKSSLIQQLALAIRAGGRTVGIVAIDPTSPFSGGSILGDRVRMSGLAGDDGVFIRAMATGGAMGGLARATLDTVDILDAAGFQVVLVETVGVGQDEVDIVRAAHTVVVVSAPGLGDGIQAIKAGVLEIADIHAVSKCDRADAGNTVADLQGMLGLGRAAKGQSGWTVGVIATSADKEQGIAELMEAIDAHRRHLDESGEIHARRRTIAEMRVLKSAEDMVRSRLAEKQSGRLSTLLDKVMSRTLDPHAAAKDLLGGFGEK